MYAYYSICILHILQKNTLNPAIIKASTPLTPAQLLAFFLQLLPLPALARLPVLKTHSFYNRLFNPLVTLWYLLFQRLHHDHTLEAAVADARLGGADRINKKLSRRLRSDSTCSYSDARQRLPWKFLLEALFLQASKILTLSPTTLWQGRVLTLLDGSTVRLRPHRAIVKEFPPQHNQHRNRAYWSLMRVVVGFCAQSGAALGCALGCIGVSEQVLACQIILRTKAKSLFIGDRNFGVFCVVQAAHHVGQEVLVRLIACRARHLLDKALSTGVHQVLWKPTNRNQLQEGCDKQPIAGRLLVVKLKRKGFRSQQLCLFTTLPDSDAFSPQELVRLYGLRWHVELNLRYLKAQMDLAQLEAKSPDMARKEWLAGLLAYNLIRAAQLCAALQQGLSPLQLSFSSVRRRLQDWLRRFGDSSRLTLEDWVNLLQSIANCRLPCRLKTRPTEPRAQRHLRLAYKALYGSRARARRNLKKYNSKS